MSRYGLWEGDNRPLGTDRVIQIVRCELTHSSAWRTSADLLTLLTCDVTLLAARVHGMTVLVGASHYQGIIERNTQTEIFVYFVLVDHKSCSYCAGGTMASLFGDCFMSE